MATKIDNIQRSLNTDFSNFLNSYYSFLIKSEDVNFVLNNELVMKNVLNLIHILYSEQISRVPYDSITSKVNEFNNHTNNEKMDELSESFSFLIQKTTDSLKVIIDSFVTNNTFNNEEIILSDKTKYENAIYAFYKVLEHTKLANAQYQSLYKETEEEVRILSIKSQESIEKYKKLNITARELKRNYNNLNVEIISVLGIFASIIFAVFGGISQLGNLGGVLATTSVSKIFIFVGASSFVLFSVVFMSFAATARLTGRELRSCGCLEKNNGEKCQHKIYERYPIYTISVIISLIILILGILGNQGVNSVLLKVVQLVFNSLPNQEFIREVLLK
ncbi:hypothetical protein SAMN05216470_0908 [Streptococcus equinus]|uniref:Uncharacterized protein n=1 Tax=Streptococcus equinus TaxID=1335 RepID=A0A239R9A6_STREI|nr:hypothetical protein [Streptococcus equinus]SNU07473.1 hypothetical protein SAMN05216470_0908 [Streptococcus equinus]